MQNGAIIPQDWPSLTVEAGEAFNLTSFALSLLLVFRTNESYSRWLDARKAWSGILIRSRDFVRQVPHLPASRMQALLTSDFVRQVPPTLPPSAKHRHCRQAHVLGLARHPDSLPRLSPPGAAIPYLFHHGIR